MFKTSEVMYCVQDVLFSEHRISVTIYNNTIPVEFKKIYGVFCIDNCNLLQLYCLFHLQVFCMWQLLMIIVVFSCLSFYLDLEDEKQFLMSCIKIFISMWHVMADAGHKVFF